MELRYLDTHAHLNLAAFADDVTNVVASCADAGVGVVNVGTKYTTSDRAVKLAAEHEHLYAIIGLHPIQTIAGMHDEDEIGEGGQPFQSKGEIFDPVAYRKLAEHKKVVAIGECGLDYYHTTADSYPAQEAAFIAQIELANELGLPLMIHTRNPKPGAESPTGRSVYEDVYELLRQYARVPGNIHFYAGTYEEAKRFFDIGFTISFTGVITFASDYTEVVRQAPLELLHAETDCPYVAPVPHRGKRCEPWMVTEVYAKIAALKGVDEEVVRQHLLENAVKLYNIQQLST